MKKINKVLLEQLISEELTIILNEAGMLNKLSAGAKKMAAGAALAGSLMGAGSAGATPEERPAAVVQSKQEDNATVALYARGALEIFLKENTDFHKRADIAADVMTVQKILESEKLNKKPALTDQELANLPELHRNLYVNSKNVVLEMLKSNKTQKLERCKKEEATIKSIESTSMGMHPKGAKAK